MRHPSAPRAVIVAAEAMVGVVALVVGTAIGHLVYLGGGLLLLGAAWIHSGIRIRRQPHSLLPWRAQCRHCPSSDLGCLSPLRAVRAGVWHCRRSHR